MDRGANQRIRMRRHAEFLRRAPALLSAKNPIGRFWRQTMDSEAVAATFCFLISFVLSCAAVMRILDGLHRGGSALTAVFLLVGMSLSIYGTLLISAPS